MNTASITMQEAVDQYAPLVTRISYRVLRRLPPCVQVDDLIQAGMLGLLEAAQHYTASNGAAFKTFASIRIHGAILDELRRLDPMRRTKRREAKAIAATSAALEIAKGRPPTKEEIATSLDVSINEYHRLARRAHFAEVSLDDAMKDPTMLNSFVDPSPGPDYAVEHIAISNWLSSQFKKLTDQQRLLMRMYYEDGYTMAEISRHVGVSQSRVSQVIQGVVAKLRTRLAA